MSSESLQDQPFLAVAGRPKDLSTSLAHLSACQEPTPDPLTLQRLQNDRTAATHHNASASGFMHLPKEIRLEIFGALLGHQLVHIRLAMGDIALKPWRHLVCQHTHSEHLEAERTHSLTAPKTSDDWEPQHHRCKWATYYNPDMNVHSNYWDHERIHLTILRVCRQVYAEANQVLWATNTFSIHEPHSLKQFLAERTPNQKGLIRHLRLRFDMTQRYHFYIRRTVLNPSLMYSLSGLNHLTLILQEEFPARLVHMQALTGRSLTEFGGNRIDAGIETLSLLPLKTLDIEVLSPGCPIGEDDPLRQAWKKDYAQGIRNCLLNPAHQIRPDS